MQHPFRESVNNLVHLKRDKSLDSIVKQIQLELKNLYHEFSAFTHISVKSLQRERNNPEYYPYSMDYVYNKEKFDSLLEKIWKVIDLVAYIMLLMCSRFYGVLC